MLEKIIDLVKSKISDTVQQDPDIPQEKKSETAQVATSSVIDSLKEYITPDNISKVTSLLGMGGNKETEDTEQVSSGIKNNMISQLTSKVGLNQGTAAKLAAGLIPAILSMLSNKVNDDKDPSFNIGSLISSFTGGNNDSSGGNSGV